MATRLKREARTDGREWLFRPTWHAGLQNLRLVYRGFDTADLKESHVR